MSVIHDLGNRRELLVDDLLLAEVTGAARLQLHQPTAREVALVGDRPWEGNGCNWITVFRDGDAFRMYYRGAHRDPDLSRGEQLISDHPEWVCYATSADGVRWERPELGLVEHDGSTANNIVWRGVDPGQRGMQGFSPFRDGNPTAGAEARYKAVGTTAKGTKKKLYAMRSPDGIAWQLTQDDPVITTGWFDSQNQAFWDAERGEYRAYVRDFRGGHPGGQRDIRTATSSDFVHWTEPQWLQYPDAPDEQLYHNQIQPYYRAPHIFVGFPARYVERGREWTDAIAQLPTPAHRKSWFDVSPRHATALTDGVFMSSRDGVTFRRWADAFLPPGPQADGNWVYGDNYLSRGMLETASAREGAPPELSLYATENSRRQPGTRIRRHTLRIDGFVSLRGDYAGGGATTHPVRFSGDRLRVNVATSAAGSLRVGLLDATGGAITGYGLDDCVEVIGDELDRQVRWRGGADLGRLAGEPVRLQFRLVDADLYAFQFTAAQ